MTELVREIKDIANDVRDHGLSGKRLDVVVVQVQALTLERDTARQERDTALERLSAAERREAALREALSWALDIMDLSDERLAAIDGPTRVYSNVHVQGKRKARAALAATEPGQEGAGT